jgi:hypothetical protein
MDEVAVSVALDGADPEDHFVYLSRYSERRDGPETMSDYLNGARRFFPMLSAGVPKMINRDHIIWLKYEKLPDLLVDGDETVIEKLTILELSDGSRLEGVLPVVGRPREYSRISDILNDPREAFVRLDDDSETYYVNKRFIRLVVPR